MSTDDVLVTTKRRINLATVSKFFGECIGLRHADYLLSKVDISDKQAIEDAIATLTDLADDAEKKAWEAMKTVDKD